MARKGRDLFEILRERSGGGSRAPTEGGGGRKAVPAGTGKVGEMSRGVVDWMKRKVGVEPEPAPRPTAAQSGLVLAAVAAIALLLGFVVGRATSGASSDSGGLRLDDSGQPKASVPGWVTEGDAVGRNPSEVSRQISTLGWPLLRYPALDRQKAADVAVWLRRSGLTETRIRTVKHRDSGEFWTFVITYTQEDRVATDLARLQALEAPDFAPELAEALARIDAPTDVTFR